MNIERAVKVLNDNPEGTKAILELLLKIWDSATLGQQVDFLMKFLPKRRVTREVKQPSGQTVHIQ